MVKTESLLLTLGLLYSLYLLVSGLAMFIPNPVLFPQGREETDALLQLCLL